MDLIDFNNKLYEIESKFNSMKKLKINEIELLYILYQSNDDKEALKDSRFDEYRFYSLYLIYANDLTFKTKYFKQNLYKNINEVAYHFDRINNQEYNHINYEELHEYMVNNDYLISIEKCEIERDKQFLEKYALNWAKTCNNERHSDESLKIISKEVRETLILKNIKSYIEDNLDVHVKHDVFIGLLKSCFVFYEARKIIEEIVANKQPKEFELNGKSIELNLYSLIHIINRHYGKSISSSRIFTDKSFHNTKIHPSKVNLFINRLFDNLRKKELDKLIEFKNDEEIIFNYYEHNYVISIGEYINDKSKIIIKTFFIIDPTKDEAKRLIDKIKVSKVYDLDGDLKIYIKNYN